jgi:hypothetical protein
VAPIKAFACDGRREPTSSLDLKAVRMRRQLFFQHYFERGV